MRALLTLLLALGTVSSVACRSSASRELAVSTVTLSITGMKCPVECPPRVHEALVGVTGVERVAVDYESATATVTGHGVDRASLVAALERAGFGERR